MKYFILALAVCFSAVPAIAGNDGPNAAPKMPGPKVTSLAQVTTSSFFTAPGSPYSTTVEVLPSGKVVVTSSIRSENGEADKVQVSALAALSKKAISNLMSDLKNLSAGKPVDTEPNTPGCMDAPGTSYSVLQNGQIVQLAFNGGCKEYRKPNMNQSDWRVLRLLQGLQDMSAILEK